MGKFGNPLRLERRDRQFKSGFLYCKNKAKNMLKLLLIVVFGFALIDVEVEPKVLELVLDGIGILLVITGISKTAKRNKGQ